MSTSPLICSARIQCEHSDSRIEILPAGSNHYAKEICRNCDRVLRFVPKPENIERRRVTAYRVGQDAYAAESFAVGKKISVQRRGTKKVFAETD